MVGESFNSFLYNGDVIIVSFNPMQADPVMHGRSDLSMERIVGCNNINTTCSWPLTKLNTSKPLSILKTWWEIINIVVWLIRI